MNIYEKLQECRVELKNKNLKQTGFNKFSNYTYFELGDFLPQAMEVMKESKLASVFGFAQDKATLTFINAENIEEAIVFETPSVIPEMKGCNAIQSIGAAQTYMRRYLYMMAFELSEADIVNTIKEPEEPEWDIKDKMIDDNKVEALLAKLKAKGVNENQICKEYGVAFIETLTVEQWTNAMRRLDKTPDKKIENLNL